MKFTTPRHQRSSTARTPGLRAPGTKRAGRVVAGLCAIAGIAFAALGVVPVAVEAPSAANAPASIAAPSAAPVSTGGLTATPIDTTINEAALNPALQVESITPTCGEQWPERGLRAAIRDEVRVGLQLRNTRALASPAQTLTVSLREKNGQTTQRSVNLPAIAAGRSASVSVPFDFPSRAPRDAQGLPSDPSLEGAASPWEVSVKSPRGVLVPWRDIAFGCVRKCPAAAIVVRKCREPGGCSDPGSGSGAEPPVCDPAACADKPPWKGKIAACSSDRIYCSYTREVSTATDMLDEDAIKVFDGEEAEVDCAVVSGAAPKPAPEDELDDLEELTQVAALSGERLGVPELDAFLSTGGAPAASPVVVAVLDTAAVSFYDEKLNDNSAHGRLVGLLAERVACGDSGTPCPVQIENHLALPIVQLEREDNRWLMDLDLERGGYLGGRGQIAEALFSLLHQWQSSAPSASRPRLVINLSFGWHSKHDCFPVGCGDAIQTDRPSRVAVPNATLPNFGAADGDEESHSLATQAVLVELARARCLGALVFAAAGNATGSDMDGPLAPAAYDRLPAQKLDCDAMFGISQPPGLSGGLVNAVSGVDFAAQRSALTRMKSIPHFVAASVGLGAMDPRSPLGVQRPRSGSSLATAVASGAAARLWAHLGPNATADMVRDALYGAGAEVPTPLGGVQMALLCTSPPCSDESHEVNACTSLRALANLNPLVNVPAGCPVAAAAPAASALIFEPTYELGKAREVGVIDNAVDKLEAPHAAPQPWGVVCATCSDTKDAQTADWKVVFEKAYAEGETPLYRVYYRFNDGVNITSKIITEMADSISGVEIPADQCRQHPLGCWSVLGTTYAYTFNQLALPATIEVKFEPAADASMGSVWPLDGDAIRRTTDLDWKP